MYLHGANVASWVDQDGKELLHLRDSNSFDGRRPIRSVLYPEGGGGGGGGRGVLGQP